MILKFLDRFKNLGLLLLRLGIGFMFINHGYDKMFGGIESWKGLGSAMGNFGIHFAPAFWGFMSALAEFFGGILFALGILFRPAALLMFFNMFVAVVFHFNKGDSLLMASQAIENGILFLSIFFIGPGKYSFDEIFLKK